MYQKILRILTRLVSFPTTNDNPSAITQCFDYIDSELSFFPFVKKTYFQNGVESRVWSTQDRLDPEYVLNAHIDVVPASSKMFDLKQNGDKVLGRGVSDMKFSIALYITILQKIYQSTGQLPSLAVMLTSDEEHGGVNGVGFLVGNVGYRPGVAFVPDGGENNHIVERAKGVLHLEITAFGKPAHAARLWEGECAIGKIAQAALNIRRLYPYPSGPIWENTLNFGKIGGGIQINQVPESASLSVDIRYLPNTDTSKIIDDIIRICPGCDVRQLICGEAFSIDRSNPYVRRWARLLAHDDSVFTNEHIASDGRHFSAIGIPAIISKPVGGLIHHPDEWSSLSSIVEFGNVLEKFLSGE